MQYIKWLIYDQNQVANMAYNCAQSEHLMLYLVIMEYIWQSLNQAWQIAK